MNWLTVLPAWDIHQLKRVTLNGKNQMCFWIKPFGAGKASAEISLGGLGVSLSDFFGGLALGSLLPLFTGRIAG